MAASKLAPEERREIALAAVKGTPVAELVRRYGISRSRIYELKDDALQGTAGAVREAELELAFRRSVLEVAGER